MRPINAHVLDTLAAAAQLLATPDRWTTRTYARDADGVDVSPFSPDAASFCLLGAMQVSAPTQFAFSHTAYFFGDVHALAEVHRFNDTHTHADILHALHAAIAAAAFPFDLPTETRS